MKVTPCTCEGNSRQRLGPLQATSIRRSCRGPGSRSSRSGGGTRPWSTIIVVITVLVIFGVVHIVIIIVADVVVISALMLITLRTEEIVILVVVISNPFRLCCGGVVIIVVRLVDTALCVRAVIVICGHSELRYVAGIVVRCNCVSQRHVIIVRAEVRPCQDRPLQGP